MRARWGLLVLASSASACATPSGSSSSSSPTPATTVPVTGSAAASATGPSKPVPNAMQARVIRIPAARFDAPSQDTRPARSVAVEAFQIDAAEVTVDDYKECVDAKVCTPPRKDSPLCHSDLSKKEVAKHPINCVDIFQAHAFCTWLGKRLPTEDEWEAAAQGLDRLPMTHVACGSSAEPSTCPVGEMNSGNEAAGSYVDHAPNGVVGLRSNVSEWTATPFIASSGGGNVPASLIRLTTKGAGFLLQTGPLDRHARGARAAYPDLGFRCAGGKERPNEGFNNYIRAHAGDAVPPSITEPELLKRYETMWRQMQAKKSNVSLDELNKAVKVTSIELQRWNSGTSLNVLYEITIDWATTKVRDSIRARIDGNEAYYGLPVDEWLAPDVIEKAATTHTDLIELARLPLGKKLKFASKAAAMAALGAKEFPGAVFRDGEIEVARPQWPAPDLYMVAKGQYAAAGANQCVDVTLNLVTGAAERHSTPCRIH